MGLRGRYHRLLWCEDVVVKNWIRRFSVFIFGLLFLVLASGLFSQAEEARPVVHSVDPHYPVDKINELGFASEQSPVAESKLIVTSEQRNSLLSIVTFSKKTRGWDLLAVDQFILKLRQRDLKRLQRAYPLFTAAELNEISNRARVD